MDIRTFSQAIRELAEEKGVAEEKVIETIELAIAAAYKKDYGKKGQIIRARFDPESGDLAFSQIKIVVDESMLKPDEGDGEEIAEEDTHSRPPEKTAADAAAEAMPELGAADEPKKIRFNPERHIMIDEARKVKRDAAVGDELEFPLEVKHEFGRIASQTAKQVIIQRIREAEREATFNEYKNRESEVISGTVQRIEGRNVFVDLGRGVALLPAEEQIPREHYAIGERIKALVLLVQRDARGPGIILSRSHPKFLEKLFALEVPEITTGAVVVRAVAREAGSRTKIAVASTDPAIDPVGSMVGQRGVRVSTVIHELGGEKIDIIEWSDDAAKFISNALSPAKISEVRLDEVRREATVLAPEDQLSLAIGKGGQNVRLAAKLTGWRIDVRSATPPAAIAAETVSSAATEAHAATPPAEAPPTENPETENTSRQTDGTPEEKPTRKRAKKTAPTIERTTAPEPIETE